MFVGLFWLACPKRFASFLFLQSSLSSDEHIHIKEHGWSQKEKMQIGILSQKQIHVLEGKNASRNINIYSFDPSYYYILYLLYLNFPDKCFPSEIRCITSKYYPCEYLGLWHFVHPFSLSNLLPCFSMYLLSTFLWV